MDKVSTLSTIEVKALHALTTQFQGLAAMQEGSGLQQDQLRRALAWLTEKGFAAIQETRSTGMRVTDSGKHAQQKGLPEVQLMKALQTLKGKAGFPHLQKATQGLENEFNAALGISKRKAWITMQKTAKGVLIEDMGVYADQGVYVVQEVLERIDAVNVKKPTQEEQDAIQELKERKLIEEKEFIDRLYKINADGLKAQKQTGTQKEEINVFNAKELVSGTWRKKHFRKYNVQDPVETWPVGKRQPYIQFLGQMRRKLIELGFKEMPAPLIVQEFYNFDVLFQPQNHPARTWTDTYHLKQPSKGKLPHASKVKAVKAAHETGGISASSGWGYSWNEEIAAQVMPSAHATAHSARQIVKGIEVPGKYFAIARCFRPDVLDATHLVEFNQMDGFIVGEDLNFKHLLGMLKQFAIEVAGAEKVRFYPDYYPFTEPSVQLSAKHPELGWIEFAGAGMFRPEMIENLGIKQPAIAWGMGIDRLAMFKLGINDVRHLFSDDLQYLRNAELVK